MTASTCPRSSTLCARQNSVVLRGPTAMPASWARLARGHKAEMGEPWTEGKKGDNAFVEGTTFRFLRPIPPGR